MPTYQLLTDRSLAQSSAITPTTLIHIVYTGDPSQNIAGSSYKAELGQLVGLFSGGSDTNFANTDLIFTGNRTHNTNGNLLSIEVSGFTKGALYMDSNQLDVGYGGNYLGTTSADTTLYYTSINRVGINSTETVINEFGVNYDFRVETDNSQNMFFVDGTNNKVGISTNTPSETLDVSGKTKTINLQVTSGATNGYVLTSDASGNASWQASTGGGTFTGGTVSGATNFTNGLTANTISATTYLNLPQFSGGSGNCITDLYTSNIHSCSPLNINPLDEGNVYFGSTSGVTVDVTNSRVGINNSNPQYRLDILDTDNRLYYDPSSAGGTLSLSGNTKLPRYDFIASPYLTKPLAGGSIGVRAWDDVIYGGYGNVGDMHIYAYNSTNGLNIVNQGPGTDTEDYIRFYAGRDALFDPDIHIQGSGSTRGYVGIGTLTPSEKLDVSGKTKTTNFQMTSGATNGYVLTSDASGNASWQTPTGGGTFTGGTVSGATNFTNGLTANTMSASTLFVNGVQITGDTYVTGLTFNTGNYDLTIGRNDGVTFTDNLGVLASDNTITGGTYNSLTGVGTFTNNTGGTFSVSGFLVGYTDVEVTGSTYNNNTFTFTNSTGGTFDVLFNTVTGLTSTGLISSNTISATTYLNIPAPTLNQVLIEGNQTLGEDIILNDMDSIINTGNTIGIQFKTGATMYQYATDNIDKTTEISLDKEFITLNATNNDDGYFATIQLDVSNNQMFEIVGDPALNNFSRTTRQLASIADYCGNSTNTDYSDVDQKDDSISSVIVSGGSEVTKWKIKNNQISGSTTNGVNTTLISLTPNNFRVETDNNQNMFFVDGTNNRIGISTNTPTEKLTVSGNTNITGTLNIGTIGSGTSVINLGLDSSGNVVTGTTGGGGTFTGGTVNGATNFTNGLTANTISATTYQNLPLDIRITGATYSNNTFTHRANTGGTYTVLFNTVTGLTVNGNLTVTGSTNLKTLTATTTTINGNLTVTGSTNLKTLTATTTTINGNLTVTGSTDLKTLTATTTTINGNLTVTGSTNLKTLTATTTTINGNLTVTGSTFNFDGTTLDLKKNSTNPNLTISDTGNTLNDPYIRFVATSAGTPTYSFGVDKSALNSFNVSYRTDASASPSNAGLFLQFTTGFTLNLPTVSNNPTLALGGSGMTFSIASNASQFKLWNGSDRNRNIEFTQYATYSAWIANGQGSGGSQHFILNNVTSGETLFGGLQKSDEVSIFHSGRTEVDGGFGVLVRGNLKVTGTTSVGTVIGTGNALYRNTTTGILAPVTSDIRVKQNVEQITNALDIVKNLRGVYYDWKDNDDFQSGDSSKQFGFIAQEVEKYLPEAVVNNGVKDYKTVKYSEMTSVLVEAIKEQQKIIEELKVRISNLES